LNQIESKGYARGLEGEVLLYGIAFDGKVPTIRMRRVRFLFFDIRNHIQGSDRQIESINR